MNEIPNDSINSSYSETLTPKSTEIEQAILGALLSNPESFLFDGTDPYSGRFLQSWQTDSFMAEWFQ